MIRFRRISDAVGAGNALSRRPESYVYRRRAQIKQLFLTLERQESVCDSIGDWPAHILDT